eukprot:2320647-Rhodomonas_salina.7
MCRELVRFARSVLDITYHTRRETGGYARSAPDIAQHTRREIVRYARPEYRTSRIIRVERREGT